MRVFVIGSGGREHALVWKLARSGRVSRLWCAPGNPAMAEERVASSGEPVGLVAIGAEEIERLREWALEQTPDLTVVGPDNPLAMGIVDHFREAGLPIWGPDRNAARFEASKGFTQAFMERHGIPTARAGHFTQAAEAKRFAAELGGQCAVKADGLAYGKGVLLCESETEAEEAIDRLLVRHELGEAGDAIVIQERLQGEEVSLHLLCDGETVKAFPLSRDYKSVNEGGWGPNTGGMGAFCPAPDLTQADSDRIQSEIVARWQAGCHADGIDYRGILYPGLMLTSEGPKVLELNARMGDPEAQVYLTRLENDLIDVLEACVTGKLSQLDLRWRAESSICVVLASGGYPGRYKKGIPIAGLEAATKLPKVKLFHAGTGRKQGEGAWETQGGRVLGVTAWDATLKAARERAYEAIEKIHFEGMHFRRDIAQEALE